MPHSAARGGRGGVAGTDGSAACAQILSKDKGGFDVFSHALEDATWRAARKYIAPFFTAANIRWGWRGQQRSAEPAAQAGPALLHPQPQARAGRQPGVPWDAGHSLRSMSAWT